MAELRVDFVEDNFAKAYLQSYMGHVAPGLKFKFDNNGNCVNTTVDIPTYTWLLIWILVFIGLISFIRKDDLLSNWPLLIFPTFMITFIIAGGVWATKRKIKQLGRKIENERNTFANKS